MLNVLILISTSYFNNKVNCFFCCSPVSGGSMNPARSLGPAILSWKFKDIWIYILAPSGGAVAGALMFRFLRLRDQHCSNLSSPNISDVGRPIPFCASQYMNMKHHMLLDQVKETAESIVNSNHCLYIGQLQQLNS